jgi:hypothetical protein
VTDCRWDEQQAVLERQSDLLLLLLLLLASNPKPGFFCFQFCQVGGLVIIPEEDE